MNIETLCKWTAPKRVQTKFGPRILRTAKPDEAFWAAWKANQGELRAQGLGCKMRQDGTWEVQWWAKISEAELAKRAELEKASFATNADVIIPAPAGLDYLPFQKAGIAFALQNTGTLIGDEMGLGKTIQAIGVINGDPQISRVLIITKASLKLNWQREVRKWLTRKLTVEIADGKLWPQSDIVVANYDIIRKWPKHSQFMWDLIVLDEVHYIKNAQAKRTIAVVGTRGNKKKDIPPQSGIPARRKLGLTGTPMENAPAELFPILSYLNPEEWGTNFWGFAKRYCGCTYNGFGYDMSGATNLDELRTRLRQTTMIRRLKKDVLTELPPKTRQIVELDPEGMEGWLSNEKATMNKHAAALEAAQVAYELAATLDSEEAYKAALDQLRQSYQIAFTEMAKVRHETALGKVEAAAEFIQDMGEEVGKVIIFAHHADVIEAMADKLGKAQTVTLTGQDSTDARQSAVDRFQKDPKVKYFIGSIRAAGEGITLTAASHVVFIELDWVPSKISQCEDRAHRIGQKDNVSVYHLVVEGSIDVKMARTCIDKQAIFDQALDKGLAVAYQEAPIFTPHHKPTATRPELQLMAATLTPEQRAGIHTGLKLLAGMDADHASQWNDMGFSKVDVGIGHSLAEAPALSPLQAALGYKLINKYRRQMPESILSIVGIDKNGKNGKGKE